MTECSVYGNTVWNVDEFGFFYVLTILFILHAHKDTDKHYNPMFEKQPLPKDFRYIQLNEIKYFDKYFFVTKSIIANLNLYNCMLLSYLCTRKYAILISLKFSALKCFCCFLYAIEWISGWFSFTIRLFNRTGLFLWNREIL